MIIGHTPVKLALPGATVAMSGYQPLVLLLLFIVIVVLILVLMLLLHATPITLLFSIYIEIGFLKCLKTAYMVVYPQSKL